MTPPSGPAPLNVRFSASVSGFAEVYFWDFGNGATSDLPNPTYTYVSPGTYTASLTVTNECGGYASRAVTVQVSGDPGVTIPAPVPGAVGGIKVVGVPNPSIDTLGNNARFARITGTNTAGQAVNFTVPINGIGNYVFFYEPTDPNVNRNLLGGDYRVEYLTASGGHATNSNGGTIQYRPNPGFTLGFQNSNYQLNSSSPFTPGPLGIQGFVRNGAGQPLQGASVTLSQGGVQVGQVQTNANGFYSFYYDRDNTSGFVEPGYYTVVASNGLASDAVAKDYNPSTVLNRGYFVQGAGAIDGGRVRDLILPRSADRLAVFRPSNGTWYITQPNGLPNFYSVQFGLDGDIPVQADYDGDGLTNIAVFRPSNGTWYIVRPNGLPNFYSVQFGLDGDIPVQADFDGDNKADIAVFRPSNGNWYLLQSRDGFVVQQFGVDGDVPVPGAYASAL